jgi:recombination protein RecR
VAFDCRDVGAAALWSARIEPVARLIESFARLPGIGPKTAQRLTYHLLRAPDAEARALAAALVDVRDKVVFCDRCFNISDAPLCPICRDPGRDATRLCVVEEPLGRPGHRVPGRIQGLYHVLPAGRSPHRRDRTGWLNRGPLERAGAPLRERPPFVEVIMAANPTLEEATAICTGERQSPL